jgi:hypothetical protein
MNWMFPLKAIGTIAIALSTLLIPTDHKVPNRAPATTLVQAVPKKDHKHDPAPEPAPAPEPLPVPPKPPEPGPVPPRPPQPEVDSDPVLEPLARAIITTWNGDDVPKVWPAGVPLDLSAVKSTAGDLPQSIQWEILPKWVDKYSRRTPKGRQISLATGTKPKTIRVTLYVAKADTFDMTTVTVSIRPDPTEPGDRDRPEPVPPEPVPPDTPVPPQPPPLSTFAKQVYDLALRDIPDIQARKELVRALATSHENIAADISQAVAGVPAYAALKQPQAIIDATAKSNKAAVGADRPAFVPFFTSLNGILKPLVKTTLATAGGHIEVWKDIAAGLRATVP